MPTTRPISDLSNKLNEISQLCHDSDEPVFITANGKRDLVVMSADAYESSQARLEIYRLLDEAEEDVRQGDEGITVQELRKRLAS